jgi:hypothetical protein
MCSRLQKKKRLGVELDYGLVETWTISESRCGTTTAHWHTHRLRPHTVCSLVETGSHPSDHGMLHRTFVFLTSIWFVGRNRAVRIATRYGLENPRIESRCGRDFPHRHWGSFSNGYRISLRGVKWSGRGVYQPLPSGTEVKETAELRLYFSSGPSWPVLGRILPCFTFYLAPYLVITSCLPLRTVAFAEDSLPKLCSPTPTFLIRDNLPQHCGLADFCKCKTGCCSYQVLP